MAVRAANLALSNLGLDTLQAEAASGKHSYGFVLGLWIQVVELEDDDVALATVNARVVCQVADDPVTDLANRLLASFPRLGKSGRICWQAGQIRSGGGNSSMATT
jgi:hypothetical protein